jgi:hypothetical protein
MATMDALLFSGSAVEKQQGLSSVVYVLHLSFLALAYD